MDTPTLTERRRAATERDIAEAAASLFAEHSVADVTAEQIAARAGVSVRTFYRYFPRKEDAIAPFLTLGATRWQAAFAETGAGPLRDGILAIIAGQLGDDEGVELDMMRALLLGVETDAALRDVWLRVNDDSERRLREILRERGLAGFDARVLAAVSTEAIRLSFEEWAATPHGPRLGALAADAFLSMSAGLRGLD
ncbi:TetR family transcriptional regulator [Streptomyces sp. AC495_CC817]|uniref:TetR/AcrR family transcriptional regulator n=1 Tax=Streptomyces sp. AC495_CC817 TaxID=2823900 RepID=UPI0027DEE512|nr:TetR family transcriptional regulator [Streptomyces sp. AC495_CC817]